MKVFIDTDKIREKGITPSQFCYLLALYLNNPITKDTTPMLLKDRYMCCNNYGMEIPKDPMLLPYGKECIEDIITNSFVKQEIEVNHCKQDRFVILASKLRELYPTGKKDGTTLQWRDSAPLLALRLKKLVQMGAEFTDEQAIKATERYVKSFNGNYRYMQVLKYFILKRGNNIIGDQDANSTLLAYIENEDNPEFDSSWNNNLI